MLRNISEVQNLIYSKKYDEAIDYAIQNDLVNWDFYFANGSQSGSLLHCLIFNGEITPLKKLIEKGVIDVDIETAAIKETSPLLFAMQQYVGKNNPQRQLEIMQLLVSKGANKGNCERYIERQGIIIPGWDSWQKGEAFEPQPQQTQQSQSQQLQQQSQQNNSSLQNTHLATTSTVQPVNLQQTTMSSANQPNTVKERRTLERFMNELYFVRNQCNVEKFEYFIGAYKALCEVEDKDGTLVDIDKYRDEMPKYLAKMTQNKDKAISETIEQLEIQKKLVERKIERLPFSETQSQKRAVMIQLTALINMGWLNVDKKWHDINMSESKDNELDDLNNVNYLLNAVKAINNPQLSQTSSNSNSSNQSAFAPMPGQPMPSSMMHQSNMNAANSSSMNTSSFGSQYQGGQQNPIHNFGHFPVDESIKKTVFVDKFMKVNVNNPNNILNQENNALIYLEMWQDLLRDDRHFLKGEASGGKRVALHFEADPSLMGKISTILKKEKMTTLPEQQQAAIKIEAELRWHIHKNTQYDYKIQHNMKAKKSKNSSARTRLVLAEMGDPKIILRERSKDLQQQKSEDTPFSCYSYFENKFKKIEPFKKSNIKESKRKQV